MSFIAGSFDATYGGAVVGQVREGFNLEWFKHGQLIQGDNFGREPQDQVIQGLELFLDFTLIEWNAAAVRSLIWPWNATFGTGPVVGTLDSSDWAPLVLTVEAGTPAAGITTEEVWTFDRAVLAEGFPVRILKGPVLKEVPLRLRVYRNASNVFFTTAAAA